MVLRKIKLTRHYDSLILDDSFECAQEMLAPQKLRASLTAMAFSKVDHLSPEAAAQRSFSSRRDDGLKFAMEQMMRAIV